MFIPTLEMISPVPLFNKFYQGDYSTVWKIAQQAALISGNQASIANTIRAIAASAWNHHITYTSQGYESYYIRGPEWLRKYDPNNPVSSKGSGTSYPVLWIPDPNNPKEPEQIFITVVEPVQTSSVTSSQQAAAQAQAEADKQAAMVAASQQAAAAYQQEQAEKQAAMVEAAQRVAADKAAFAAAEQAMLEMQAVNYEPQIQQIDQQTYETWDYSQVPYELPIIEVSSDPERKPYIPQPVTTTRKPVVQAVLTPETAAAAEVAERIAVSQPDLVEEKQSWWLIPTMYFLSHRL